MRLGYKIWMVSLCFSHMIYKSNTSQGWQYLVPVVPTSLAGTRIQQKISEIWMSRIPKKKSWKSSNADLPSLWRFFKRQFQSSPFFRSNFFGHPVQVTHMSSYNNHKEFPLFLLQSCFVFICLLCLAKLMPVNAP